MASEALIVLLVFLTGGLAIAWKYPDATKHRLDQLGLLVQGFYVLLVLAFAVILLSSGMTFLILFGAVIVTLLVLRVWSRTGTNPLEEVME